MQTRDKLISAVTQYDAKQSRKPGHNIYALPQYFERIDLVMADIEAGATPRRAILAGFTGRLADTCLKAIGEKPYARDEEPTSICYRPANAS